LSVLTPHQKRAAPARGENGEVLTDIAHSYNVKRAMTASLAAWRLH
jgi:hypothetical protein